MNRYLDPSGATKPARVYDYGIVPEVTVDRFGNATVEAIGRSGASLASSSRSCPTSARSTRAMTAPTTS